MKKYDHKRIEKKWQDFWDKEAIYKTEDTSDKPKFYTLVEFPYPSGEGLHTGHVLSYTALDIVSRKRRAQGFNVLYPIGWDAFGLPTENYAIKTGIHPKDVTKQNTDNFRRQLKSLGFSFDWSREINTSDPAYYKWTQWIFLQFFKAGLAYKKELPINWCLSCKIGLANEEVVEGRCERCGGETEKRNKKQWMLAITKYADKLLANLKDLEYLPEIKTQQTNWIGKSEGVHINFPLTQSNELIKVFTTRPDTVFGVTYVVLAPEHALIAKLSDKISNKKEVDDYIKKVQKKTEIERTDEEKEKTGVRLKGITCTNPVNGRELPVFIADYVLSHYGTGAVMAVPAHDERDFIFAKKYNLPFMKVILPPRLDSFPRNAEDVAAGASDALQVKAECWTEAGEMTNSGQFTGEDSETAKEKISNWIEENGWGEKTINYRLRDWVFSRQRYWGEPIPIIHCEKCGEVAVPEDELPLELPEVEEYTPGDDGESPLAKITDWVHTKCPQCGGNAKRETDVMPNWAGSSWYFLRYIDPHNDKTFADKEKLKYFMPVDWYNGGMEHTTLHLLYSRFWNLFLYDQGHVPVAEPYKKRTAHGMILAEGGVKMSKSKGNVVNPDEIVEMYGADTLRIYEMFMGPFNQAKAWNPNDIVGSRKFIEKVWDYVQSWSERKEEESPQELTALLHKTVKKVLDDIETMDFNTAVSTMMVYINAVRRARDEKEVYIAKDELESFLKVFGFFAPHTAEELWSGIGNGGSICTEPVPEVDESKIQEEKVKIVVQVNGKMRDTLEAPAGLSEEEVKERVYKSPALQKWVPEKDKVKKEIYVPDKIFNIVV